MSQFLWRRDNFLVDHNSKSLSDYYGKLLQNKNPSGKKKILHVHINSENEITDDIFKIVEEESNEPNIDEVLVRVDTIAIDAWIRTTFDEGSYHETSKLEQGIGALGLGEVIISKSDKFKEGDIVSGPMGAQTHITMNAMAYEKIETNKIDPELNIGL